MRYFYLYIFLFLSCCFFAQKPAAGIDSLIKVWERTGVPQNHINDYNEYKSVQKKIAGAKKENNSHLNTKQHENLLTTLDACYNPGFELGNFNNWIRYSGASQTQGLIVPNTFYDTSQAISNGTTGLVFNTTPFTTDVFVLNTAVATDSISGVGYDEYSLDGVKYNVKKLKEAGSIYSARINNSLSQYRSEKINYKFTVTSGNPYFIYNYAIVLSDGGHQDGEQASFVCRVLDSVGNIIPLANAPYYVNANNALTDPTFNKSSINDIYFYSDVYYKNWTTDTINLCQFIGKTLSIEFEAIDCIYGAHFCYAYIDAKCGQVLTTTIQSPVCPDSSNFNLIAPGGYASYQWYDPQGNVISSLQTGNQQTLNMNQYVANCTSGNCNIKDGDVFSVVVTTTTGCVLKLNCTIKKPGVKISGVDYTPTCLEGSNGSINITGSGGLGSGTYSYVWYANNCTGNPIGTSNVLTNIPAGNYCVHVTSGFCPAKDTVFTLGSLPLNAQFSTVNLPVCLDPNYPIHTIPTGNNYTWYANGNLLTDHSDSLQINPLDFTSVYSVSFFNTATGCKDSVQYSLSTSNSDTSLIAVYCPNDSLAVLIAPAANPGNFTWYYNYNPVPGATNDTLMPVYVKNLSMYYSIFYSGTCRRLAKRIKHVFPSAIFIPDTTVNIFTPNDDGINDLYFPFYDKNYVSEQVVEQTVEYDLIIYNRWGQVVFQSDRYTSGWNGNDLSGKAATEGTYYWIANFSNNCSANPDKIIKKGFLQLIR